MMKKGLFQFSISTLVVFASVIVIDYAVGKAMDRMLPQISNQCEPGKIYYSLYDVNTPVVITGSSRAVHHYVSQVIEDSLQMPVYNVAIDGRFFNHNCCVINSILDRYSPKLIIWEFDDDYLYNGIKDPVQSLYPYYNKNHWVKNTINEELSWTEYIRLNSHLFQYNSKIHLILRKYLMLNSYVDDTEKGYVPLPPKSLRQALVLEPEISTFRVLNDSKVERFRSLLNRAKEKGVKIIIVDSPLYKQCSANSVSALNMNEICEQYGALFIDNSQLPYFLEHPELFNDNIHLNESGALIYTKIFIEQIYNLYTSF